MPGNGSWADTIGNLISGLGGQTPQIPTAVQAVAGASSAPQMAPVAAIPQNPGTPDALANAIAASNPSGSVDAFLRNTANGASFHAADAVAAAGDATLPLDSWSSSAPGWGQRYDENLNNQNIRSQANGAASPAATAAGRAFGYAMNPGARTLVDGAPNMPGKLWGGVISGILDGFTNGLRLGMNPSDQKNETATGALSGAFDGLKSGLGR